MSFIESTEEAFPLKNALKGPRVGLYMNPSCSDFMASPLDMHKGINKKEREFTCLRNKCRNVSCPPDISSLCIYCVCVFLFFFFAWQQVNKHTQMSGDKMFCCSG